MIKVLYITSTIQLAGAEFVIQNYLKNIDKTKVAVDLLVLYSGGGRALERPLKDLGCNIFDIVTPPSLKNNFKHMQEVETFFKEHKDYDILHIHAQSAIRYVYAKIAKKNGVKKVVFHSHASQCGGKVLLHKLCKGKLNKWCDLKLACSGLAGKSMYKGDFQILNNAIDTSLFLYNKDYREEIRAELGIGKELVLGNVSRLVPVKNHKFILNVAKKLSDKSVAIKLVFVGSGDEKQNIIDCAKELGLQDKLILVSANMQAHKYYSAFDVFLMPSLYEGLSLALVEAQTNGCAVIASKNVATETKMTDNFQFLPIDKSEENYEAWVNAVLTLTPFTHADNKLQIEQSGYDVSHEAIKLEKLYEDLLKG